jgi:hypothetical protein
VRSQALRRVRWAAQSMIHLSTLYDIGHQDGIDYLVLGKRPLSPD